MKEKELPIEQVKERVMAIINKRKKISNKPEESC